MATKRGEEAPQPELLHGGGVSSCTVARPVRPILIILLAAFLLPAAAPAQDVSNPAKAGSHVPAPPAWTEFIAWYRATPGLTDPGAIFAAYAEKLKADGLAEAAVKERLALLAAEAPRRRLELTAAHFDKIYASPTPPFRTDASAYLRRAIEGRTPDTALDVAMGQGRNALYLAANGWKVTGYDVAEGGLAAARAEAGRLKVTIQAVRASHEDFDFGVERWDLIVMTYAAAPMDDARFLARVRDSLKPGGIVVVEQFNAPPDSPANKGPANALLKSFEGLRVIHYEDTVARSEWGGALCRVGRITAEKDGPAGK